jgi:CheY-like chemotaxis protein
MEKIIIFYADDDEDDLMLFNEAIEKIAGKSKNKINLQLHKNGESLIENIKKNKGSYGIIFLDINMPLKSGFQLLTEIRNEPDIKMFPVIMYSTSSNKDNINQSQSLGANIYVIKPNKFNELVRMISTLIQTNWQNHKANTTNFLYKGPK